jgi:lipopolysaccharide transport system ATP-binding protein
VGDAEFQKKCLGKMGDVSKSDGRTVLFVSHNMIAVQKLCSSAIVLKNGKKLGQGETSDMVTKYLNDGSTTKYQFDGTKIDYNQDKIRLINARIDKIRDNDKINISDSFDVFLEIKSLCTTNVNFTLMVYSQNEEHILSTTSLNRNGDNYNMESGNFQIKCTIPGDFFNCGTYKFTLLVVENYSTVLLKIENIFILDFDEEIYDRGDYFGPWSGIVRPKWNWNLNKTI